MNVDPVVYTGLPEFGYEVDSTLQAFNKYNRHTHSIANPTSFLAEDININDEVSIISKSGKDVFYRPTPSTKVLVTDITANSITVSSAASEEISNGILLVTRDGINQKVENINIELNSAIITREPLSGLSTPKIIDSSITKTLSIYATIPENTLSGSPDTQLGGSFLLDATTTTINVSGTGINGTSILPALTLYRGKKYNFSFTNSAIANRRIYLLRSPSYVQGQYPPVNNYTLGVSQTPLGELVTQFDFTVPYSVQNILYYVCPELNNKIGVINILNSDLDELPWSVGSVQVNISSILPEGLPDFTLPILLKAPSNLRLVSVNLLPIWSNPFSAGRFLTRFSNSLNASFNYLTSKQVVNSIGTKVLTVPSNFIEKDSTTQILFYEIQGLKAVFIEATYVSLV